MFINYKKSDRKIVGYQVIPVAVSMLGLEDSNGNELVVAELDGSRAEEVLTAYQNGVAIKYANNGQIVDA